MTDTAPTVAINTTGLRHIIWDWNGTLLHDFALIVSATNEAFSSCGFPEVTEEQYQANYMRPIASFYERLIGRPLEVHEWHALDDAFHAAYDKNLTRTALAHGALDALALAAERGWTQSLLSMYPHDGLLPLLDVHALRDYFSHVDGLRSGERGGSKLPYLQAHIEALGINASSTLLIGDSLDDAAAAAGVGAPCILLASGWHAPADLEAVGVPVIRSLTEVRTLLR